MVAFVPVLIDLAYERTDFANRQFHAAARMHPGHAQHARLWGNGGPHGTQHLVGAHLPGLLEQA
ncbi:hypothetical protein D3C78_1950180 [compost metagenome]